MENKKERVVGNEVCEVERKSQTCSTHKRIPDKIVNNLALLYRYCWPKFDILEAENIGRSGKKGKKDERRKPLHKKTRKKTDNSNTLKMLSLVLVSSRVPSGDLCVRSENKVAESPKEHLSHCFKTHTIEQP